MKIATSCSRGLFKEISIEMNRRKLRNKVKLNDTPKRHSSRYLAINQLFLTSFSSLTSTSTLSPNIVPQDLFKMNQPPHDNDLEVDGEKPAARLELLRLQVEYEQGQKQQSLHQQNLQQPAAKVLLLQAEYKHRQQQQLNLQEQNLQHPDQFEPQEQELFNFQQQNQLDPHQQDPFNLPQRNHFKLQVLDKFHLQPPNEFKRQAQSQFNLQLPTQFNLPDIPLHLLLPNPQHSASPAMPPSAEQVQPNDSLSGHPGPPTVMNNGLGSGPHKCTVEGCNSTFKVARDLNQHIRGAYSHEFDCPWCAGPPPFSSRTALEVHLYVIHGDDWPFVCRFCERAYRDQLRLDSYSQNSGHYRKVVAAKQANTNAN